MLLLAVQWPSGSITQTISSGCVLFLNPNFLPSVSDRNELHQTPLCLHAAAASAAETAK